MDEFEIAFLDRPIQDSVSSLSAPALAILWQLVEKDPNDMKVFTNLQELAARFDGYQEDLYKGFLELFLKRYIYRHQDEDNEYYCKLRPEALSAVADYLANLKPVLEISPRVSP